MKVSRIFVMVLSVTLVLSLGFSAFLPSAQAQQSSATVDFTDPLEYQLVFDENWPDDGGTTYWMPHLIPRGQTIANTDHAYMHNPMPPTGNLVLGSWNTQRDGSGTVLTVNTPIFRHMIVYAQWVTPPPPPPPPSPSPSPLPVEVIEILPDDVPLAPVPPEVPVEIEILPNAVPLALAPPEVSEIPDTDEIEILPDDVPLAPAPPDTLDVTEPDEIEILPDADLTEIEDAEVPLAYMPISGNWAMSNLILSILGILVIPTVLTASKRRGECVLNKTQKNVCLALTSAAGIASVVVFALTQDMRALTIAADSWTVLHAAMLAVQGTTATLLIMRKSGSASKAA